MTSGFGRFDFDCIARWIEPGERVLDLGCGDGDLLKFLQDEKAVQGYGIELDPEHVVVCMRQGVNVLQLDLERGLAGLEDDSFDHVIMSLSLQTVRHTEQLLREMLRVGHEAVVSFPNFGYRKHREALAAGRMPVSKHLPYQWYNTPNLRFFTIADFEQLCADNGFAIRELQAFDEGLAQVDDPNLNADVALYRLGRA